MSRNYSEASSNASTSKNAKARVSEVDDVDGQNDLEPVRSRHVGIANEPHPHADAEKANAEAQRAALGLDLNEEIHIVDWDGPLDPDNPFNWSRTYKWVATLTTCFISILTGIPAGAYGAASAEMSRAWDVDEANFPHLSFALVSWNIGAAVFPLLFVPLTENTGRMPGYFVSYIVFLIFLIPAALAPNFETIVITRFFGGGASSVAINIVGGTITDIWKGDKERSLPMSIFGMTSVVGIALGPFIGGAIRSGLHWRWIYWIQIIVDAALLPFFYLILRETRGDVILAKRAKKLRKQGQRTAFASSELSKPGILEALKISFMRPVKMLATEFVVSSFTLWVSFAWGILFLFQTSVPIVFSELYGFSVFQTSLIQLALSFGAIVGTIVNPIQDMLYLNSAKRNMERPGKPIPEARLYFAVPGSLIFTVGMFWYGWSSYPDLPWIVPALGIGCVGFGIYSIYLAVVNYLADAYEKYAASALSAASMGRNVFGAFLPLATPALYRNLSFPWASSLLGFIGLVLSLVPVVLLLKGEAIRARSPFMLDAAFDGEEKVERRESIASRYTAERRKSAVLPWSSVRAVDE